MGVNKGKDMAQRCCHLLRYRGKKQRAERNQTRQEPSRLTYAKTDLHWPLAPFLGSKLRNTERTQHPRIKDDSSVLRKRTGEQAADRRLPVSSLTDLGKTTVPCGPAWHTQCLHQPARLSVQPQTAASRAQAAGHTAQKMPTRLQGSPGSDRRVIMLEIPGPAVPIPASH